METLASAAENVLLAAERDYARLVAGPLPEFEHWLRHRDNVARHAAWKAKVSDHLAAVNAAARQLSASGSAVRAEEGRFEQAAAGARPVYSRWLQHKMRMDTLRAEHRHRERTATATVYAWQD